MNHQTHNGMFRGGLISAGVLFVWSLSACMLYAQQERSPLEIVTEGRDEGFFARQKAAGKLGAELDVETIKALYDFMNIKARAGLSGDELLALKDAVCTKLDHQKRYPAELPAKLMEMYADEAHDITWRDYCIQHLNTGFRKATAEQREAIWKVFWAAAEDEGSIVVGTALISLRDNMSDKNADRSELTAKALEVVTRKSSCEASRTTALQICAYLGEKKCLPFARELAASTKSRTLKLSSIAAIGTLGGDEDRVLLEKYASSTDRLTQIAAQSALKKLTGGTKESKRL